MSWIPTLQLLLDQLQTVGGGSGRTQQVSSPSATAAARQGPLVCCFTDFNSEAVHRSRQLLDYLLASQAAGGSSAGEGDGGGGSIQPGNGGLVVQEELNPFRKPAAVLASDNALPSASNGFALWLEPCTAC